MGFINRFKSLFSSKSESLDEQPKEFHDPHQVKMAEAFVERQPVSYTHLTLPTILRV